MRAICASISILLGSAAVAWAEPNVVSVTYSCERGVEVPVTFININDGPGLAVMMVEDKLVPMRQLTSGSGIRYAALDEQDGYRFRGKGRDATISWLAADHTATEQVLLKACQSAQ